MISKQKQKRHSKEIVTLSAISAPSEPKPETIADVLNILVQRDRLELNSALPQDYIDKLSAELTASTGIITRLEVIQRYRALVRLLSADADYHKSRKMLGAPGMIASARLNKAVQFARSYGWGVEWNSLNTALERVE